MIALETVQRAIAQASDYLSRQIKADGQFEYRLNLDTTIKVKAKYNILRHAGAIYALASAYQKHPDAALKTALERAGNYLRNQSIAPLPGEESLLAVWSDPKINGSNKPRQAKLGGTGLGLVALLSLETITPNFTPLAELQGLGRFLVSMQKADGGFYSKYIPSRGGRMEDWQSLFYPGEAALGLLMLYERDNAEVWLNTAYKTLEFLARSREQATDIPIDHWALLATQKLFSLNILDRAAQNLLMTHAMQICEAILQTQVVSPQRPDYTGGFTKNGRVTPTATRLEGLLAAITFLPQEGDWHSRLETSITAGIEFLLRSQVKTGAFAGAFPRAIAKLKRDTPTARKFNRRVSEVRIDYVQHALTALLQYAEVSAN
ncbi:hypothetical protein PN462_13525 [Spirulina sp. CS-785/01]|uniref:hypothetical protein n=1 Tax=Spirulina sp. CS-785/01 TaxID=3021716 RepID=UPI00232AEA04|nr:hypothetical protein [Spirulina sp. CS-785/01]MDB9314126.1 hypothetical protein [Spirulina sp. CS-785/01]